MDTYTGDMLKRLAPAKLTAERRGRLDQVGQTPRAQLQWLLAFAYAWAGIALDAAAALGLALPPGVTAADRADRRKDLEVLVTEATGGTWVALASAPGRAPQDLRDAAVAIRAVVEQVMRGGQGTGRRVYSAVLRDVHVLATVSPRGEAATRPGEPGRLHVVWIGPLATVAAQAVLALLAKVPASLIRSCVWSPAGRPCGHVFVGAKGQKYCKPHGLEARRLRNQQWQVAFRARRRQQRQAQDRAQKRKPANRPGPRKPSTPQQRKHSRAAAYRPPRRRRP